MDLVQAELADCAKGKPRTRKNIAAERKSANYEKASIFQTPLCAVGSGHGAVGINGCVCSRVEHVQIEDGYKP